MNDDLFTISLPTPDHSRMLFNGVSSFMITSNPHDQLMSTNPYPSAIQEEIGNPFPDICSGNVDMGTPLPATSIPKPFGQSLFNFNSSLAINSCGTGHDEFLQVMSTVHPSYHVSESTFPGWNVNNTNCPLPRNELSLSLGSCSEKSCSVVTQVTSKDAEELSLYGLSSSVHFPHVLGSRYFHLSEEILAEVVNYALGNCDEMDFDKGSSVVRSDEFASSYGEITAREEIENQVLKEKNAQKIELLTLLQTVNHRFNQYLDRIQNAVAIFHDATNSTGPQRLAQFALNTLSSTYRNLRERIISQIILSGQENNRECMRGKAKAFESSFIQKQWALQELGRKDQQSWRPQRGLPERSVSVLRAWMFQNFLHPYPKDNDKHLLALQSGLTRNQVSNWFINARVRLWKPMIEEMYSEIKKHQTEEGTEGDFRSQGNIGNQRP